MKYAALQAETSGTRGVQEQAAPESSGPPVGFNEKRNDETPIHLDNETPRSQSHAIVAYVGDATVWDDLGSYQTP